MQYTYVGVDSHRDTHTAVFLDCFFEKLGEIKFDNLPSVFGQFLTDAEQYLMEGTVFMFGMEDIGKFGRTLTRFLNDSGQQVKQVNALLVARERLNRNIMEKSDSIDAECAARVLLSKFGELPVAVHDDKFWVLRSLVVRRDHLVRHGAATKHYLHSLLIQQYPNYTRFFSKIVTKSSMAFFMRYPSPGTLQGTTAEELAVLFERTSNMKISMAKAKEILDTLQDTAVPYQEIRDSVVQSTIKQLEFNMAEIERLEKDIALFLAKFDCKLTTITGIDTVSAAQILSCIGDIRRFPTSAKLARYAGIAPVTYASGKKDTQHSNQRGNRELNSLLFWLSVRMSMTYGPKNRVLNSFFYDYYRRKMSEGKTKRQALKCVQRRLINIIWTMLTHNEEYVNPPAYDLPDVDEVDENVSM
jgi:transposase